MSSIVKQLTQKQLIQPPSFIADNIVYETMVGSISYGVSTNVSDIDIIGVCIPPKKMIFPHLAGEIFGFGRQHKRFNVYQQHHIKDGKKTYDIATYNIVSYFNLCMENNPNMLDSLYTPLNCVLHCSSIGNIIRDNRDKFLHKGSWFKFKGYAYSQLHKMQSKNPDPGSKREKLIEEYGYDVKFAYHLVRLLTEIETILTEQTLILGRNKEHLKAIRNGEVKQEDVVRWAEDKLPSLEKAYENSKLPHSPNEAEIKSILLSCLEHHYGNLSADCVVIGDKELEALRKIYAIAGPFT